MEKRKVSVILPTYNRAYIIKNSIRSILDQTYKDYELIIVDDGSTDETENVINEINDDRIIYHKFVANSGGMCGKKLWNRSIKRRIYSFSGF
ncbi:MAG: glycosyltransferase family 2 protein [Lachnospira pectinoschiza]